MKRSTARRRRCVAAWLGAALTAWAAVAATATEPPLALVVNSDSPELTFARLQAALATSLDAQVVGASEQPVRGTVTVTWRPSRRELAVTYQHGRRGTVSRVVPAPDDADGAIDAATALAANLVRNEADELLGPAPSPPPLPPAPAPPPAAAVVAAPAPPPRPHAPVVGSILYPLASNYKEPDVRTRLSLNLVYGRVGELEGAQLGFGANAVDGPVLGGQVAFGFNLAGGAVSGFQAAMGLNYAGGPVYGFQSAFGLNRSGGGRGLQLSFGLNSAGGPWSGLQAGAVNVGQEVRGVQLGLVNVAGRVRGVQLGLINIAEDVEGIPIGLISVTRTGGVHPVFWSGTETAGNVGLKFATRYTYTLLSGSARRDDNQSLFGPGLALGVRIPFLPGYFESDLGATFLFGGPLCCVNVEVGLSDDLLLGRWRSLVGFEVHRRFSLFFGAALTALGRFEQAIPDRTIELRPELFGGVQL
jgi:hypothetical protein